LQHALSSCKRRSTGSYPTRRPSAGGSQAIAQAAERVRRYPNEDGGFGHFPGGPSDADAIYFQVGVLVMAGYLKPADPLPNDPGLLGWGHLMPLKRRD
jgi:hypothetical protein